MKRLLTSTFAAVAALALAPAAQAANFPVGSTNFTASGGPNGTFSGFFGNNGIAAGAFTDTFTFTLPINGIGSGTVTTSASIFGSANDLDFTSVLVNNVVAPITRSSQNLFESAGVNSVAITAGVLNTITVTGVSRGNGAYGGQATFIPTVTSAVPEPSTWAMLLVGFGMTGVAMRYRRRNTKVAYA